MIRLLHSLRWQLAHAHQSLHILARPTALAAHEQELLQVSSFKFQVSLNWITQASDKNLPLLLGILQEQGLDDAWAHEQLSSGSSAILATVEENGQTIPAGVGLYTRGEFYVGEIDHLYHPGPTACYLYATYVSPAYRGRRIQRLLDLHRVQKGAQDGVPHAIAIVLSSNTASLRGHAAGGFLSAARIDHFRFRRSSIIILRKKTSRLPVGNFPGGGFFRSPFLHFS
ncbi:MAG TPA: GNAT family N-acetyltransferase, partial [Tepidisphaeraceae bacterium]|nr:GNAT family N-acetyltransferase [Tepidisphaeraceae bacterium]